MRKLVDGTLCYWCGLPMFRDAVRNWDHSTLAGDHTVPRVAGGEIADRLLHSRCNSQRQDGRYDDERPVLTDTHPGDWKPSSGSVPPRAAGNLAMDW